jgi:DNA-binding transcriptional LysR family regulator
MERFTAARVPGSGTLRAMPARRTEATRARVDVARAPLLEEVWRWLPTFRVVAETQSVARTAEHLKVSPGAVSRSVAQVEVALGVPLFDRVGKRLQLNLHGQALLDAVRDADLRLVAALDSIGRKDAVGFVRLAAVGQLGRVFLLPAVEALAKSNSELRLSIDHLDPELALERLKAGSLDGYLTLNVAAGDPLVGTRLAQLELMAFAGPTHPLFDAKELTEAHLPVYGFVAQGRPSLMRSPWPLDKRRIVSLQTDSHALALEACLRGTHLMLMERVFGRDFVRENKLHALEVPFVEKVDLMYFQHRRSLKQAVPARVEAEVRRAVERITTAA